MSVRTRELIEAGLIVVRYDQVGRHPLYMLTPTGKRILELLEEIERVYRDRVSFEEKEDKWLIEGLKRRSEK